jgi:hypothetical protein
LLTLFITPQIKAETLFEESELEEFLQQPVFDKDYPGAGAVILENNIEADFTALPYQIKVTALIRVFNKKGADEFSELRIDYNQNREEVNILKAGVFSLDSEGNLFKVVSNNIATEVPGNLEAIGFKTEGRVKIIRFNSLKQGDIISYSYLKLINKPLIDQGFSLKKYLQFFEPIKKMKMTVKVPADRQVHYKVVDLEAVPTFSIGEGEVIYNWELQNLPPLTEEPALPPPDNFVPHILISSFNSWYEFCDWYNNLYISFEKDNSGIKELTSRLTSNQVGLLQRIKTLYNYVAFEVNYIALDPWIDGFIPRQFSEITTKMMGSSVDKSWLLISLLKEIGVKAEPVLINISGQIDQGVVVPRDLNHMLVYLPDYYLYLDPSFNSMMFANLPYFAQGKKALHPLSYTLSKTPTSLPGENQEILKQRVLLKGDYSALIDLEWEARGYFDMLRKTLFREYLPDQRELLLKQLVNRGFYINEVKLNSIEGVDNLEKYFSIEATFKASDYAEEMDGRLFIKPLRLPLRIKEFFQAEKRENPLYLHTAQLVNREVEIAIPDDYRVFYLPQDVEFSSGPGSFELTFRERRNRVITRFVLEVKNKLILPEEYQLFCKLLEKVEDVFKKQIVLEKMGPE